MLSIALSVASAALSLWSIWTLHDVEKRIAKTQDEIARLSAPR